MFYPAISIRITFLAVITSVSLGAMSPEVAHNQNDGSNGKSTVCFIQASVPDRFAHRTVPPHIAFVSEQVVAAVHDAERHTKSECGVIKLYDVHADISKPLLTLEHDQVRVIAADDEKHLLFSGSSDGTLKVFDLKSSRYPIRNFRGTFAPIQQIVPGKDGLVAVIQASFKSLCLVDVLQKTVVADVQTSRRASVYDAAFHPTNKSLIYSITRKPTEKSKYAATYDLLNLGRLDYNGAPEVKRLQIQQVGPCAKPVITYQPGTNIYRCGGASLGNSAPLYVGDDSSNWAIALPDRGGTCGILQYGRNDSHLLTMMRHHKHKVELAVHVAESGNKVLDTSATFYPAAIDPNASCVVTRKRGALEVISTGK